MRKIHISATTAVLLALFTLSSEVSATDIPSPANVIGDTTTSPEITLAIGSTNYWGMGGGSNNFRIFDFTNNNPVISIAASSEDRNSIRVEPNGNLGLADDVVYINRSARSMGIGTNAPSATLDVQWNGSNTVGDGLTNLLVLSATNSEESMSSDAGFRLVNGSTSKGWNFRTNSGGDSFNATLQGTGGSEFTITNATSDVSGTELYLGNGAKNIAGVWINASSRALKENIKELSTQDALAAFHKLQPVTYNYKSDKKEQVVGFIAEDVPELVAIQSRDGLSSMDMVAVITKVVQEQEKMLKVQAEKIAKLEAMQKRLAKVESLLTNLALDTSNSKTEKVSVNLK